MSRTQVTVAYGYLSIKLQLFVRGGELLDTEVQQEFDNCRTVGLGA